jgi:ribosomal protein S27AE
MSTMLKTADIAHECPRCGRTYTAGEIAQWEKPWRDQLDRELTISRHTTGCPRCAPDMYPGAASFDGCGEEYDEDDEEGDER